MLPFLFSIDVSAYMKAIQFFYLYKRCVQTRWQTKRVTDQIHDVCAIVHAHKSLSFPPHVFWSLEFKCTCFVLKGIFAMLCISLYLQLGAACSEKNPKYVRPHTFHRFTYFAWHWPYKTLSTESTNTRVYNNTTTATVNHTLTQLADSPGSESASFVTWVRKWRALSRDLGGLHSPTLPTFLSTKWLSVKTGSSVSLK